MHGCKIVRLLHLTIIILTGAQEYLCCDISWRLVDRIEDRYCVEIPQFYTDTFRDFADAFLRIRHGIHREDLTYDSCFSIYREMITYVL